jgi:predicted phosphodiesterase
MSGYIKMTHFQDFQIISDIHTDVRESAYYVPPVAPFLIIAGDLCPMVHPNYRDFLLAATSNHRRVFYVAGNHEYYESPLDPLRAQEHMESVCKSMPSDVTFLRAGGSVGSVPGVSLIGATLWTNIDPVLSSRLEHLLNDFKYIKVGGEAYLSGHDMTILHERDKRWIEAKIRDAAADGSKCVVVTHHSPDRRLSIASDDKATAGYGPLYYASDMLPTMMSAPIVSWVYGHTHESHYMKLPEVNTTFATNALGYPGERTGHAQGAGIRVILQ